MNLRNVNRAEFGGDSAARILATWELSTLRLTASPTRVRWSPPGSTSYSGRVAFDPAASTDVHPDSLQLLLAVGLAPLSGLIASQLNRDGLAAGDRYQ